MQPQSRHEMEPPTERADIANTSCGKRRCCCRQAAKWKGFMSDSNKIRVLCIDDHPTVLDGLSAIINLQPDMTVAGASPPGRPGLQQFRAPRPCIVLVGPRLPRMSGFRVIGHNKTESSNAPSLRFSSQ